MEPSAAHLPHATTQRATRRRRLEELGERKDAVKRALDAYQAMDHGQTPVIGLRAGSVRLPRPRPALPDEAEKYAEHVRRRLVVKPGLTGLWQVNGRSDLSWEESVRLDLRYVENWSFALDLQIMWKTISVLVRGSGAY